MKLNYHDQFDQVWSIMKTRQDNYVTDQTGAIYAEIETKLSLLIKQDAVYHKKLRGQRCDRLYRCDIHRIQY